MRIISGKYRGKKLKEFELGSTKPTLDRVKESIFNLIQFNIYGAVVLDLFSGTGALGIEAISRGASKVFLVDNNSRAIKLIKDNLKGMEGDFSVIQQDALNYLGLTNECYDIVLLDPPYKTELGVQAIKFLIKNNRIREGGIIIFETAEENNFQFQFEGFHITQKRYGTVSVYKMEKE